MSGRFGLHPTPIAGAFVVERRPLGDERGFLERLFCVEELAAAGFATPPVQINRTLTRRAGTVRGLHFQMPPHAEIKLVACLRGRVFDVVVDLRRGSPTFLAWHAEILDATAHRSLVIPRGCAHGLQTLAADCEMLYLHDDAYAPTAEAGIHPADPRLAIPWPAPIEAMSDRDRSLPRLADDFEGVVL